MQLEALVVLLLSRVFSAVLFHRDGETMGFCIQTDHPYGIVMRATRPKEADKSKEMVKRNHGDVAVTKERIAKVQTDLFAFA